jgi:hypothetical protein
MPITIEKQNQARERFTEVHGNHCVRQPEVRERNRQFYDITIP